MSRWHLWLFVDAHQNSCWSRHAHFGELANVSSRYYCCKLQMPVLQLPIRTQLCPNSNASVWWNLTSMRHLLRVGNLFLCSLYAHCTQLQQKLTKWALCCHAKLSVNGALEWLFQYSANIGVFLVAQHAKIRKIFFFYFLNISPIFLNFSVSRNNQMGPLPTELHISIFKDIESLYR